MRECIQWLLFPSLRIRFKLQEAPDDKSDRILGSKIFLRRASRRQDNPWSPSIFMDLECNTCLCKAKVLRNSIVNPEVEVRAYRCERTPPNLKQSAGPNRYIRISLRLVVNQVSFLVPSGQSEMLLTVFSAVQNSRAPG
jgi:hypothetical protein